MANGTSLSRESSNAQGNRPVPFVSKAKVVEVDKPQSIKTNNKSEIKKLD